MAESKIAIKKKSSKKKNKSKNSETGDGSDEGDSSSGSSVSAQETPEGDEEKGASQIGRGVGTAAVTVDRDEYLRAHRDLTNERNQLQMKNNLLHRRLAEYYKKRKLDHVLKPLEGAADLEEKYNQNLITYDDLKIKSERDETDIKLKVQVVDMQYLEKLEYAEKKFDALQGFEKNTGLGLIYSKKGKPIADKTIVRFLTLQRRKQEQASALCLRYIRARNAVAELDDIVKKLEMLGPGLYVAQYEQLEIDNQNYNTKIEEREDELIKNRSKCTEHNQMLAHIREKMHHTDEVIDMAECELGDAEVVYLRAREELGFVKNRRDRLRYALQDEKVKAGLLTRKDLLRDFQNATDEVGKLRKKKELLKAEIERTTKQLREVRKQEISNQKSPNQGSSTTIN